MTRRTGGWKGKERKGKEGKGREYAMINNGWFAVRAITNLLA
jgi:hypothetical protein